MAFPNAKKILRIGSPLSSWKLLLIAALFSRPRYRGLCHLLLRPFVHDGAIAVTYRAGTRYLKAWLRLSDIESDFQSVLELGTHDSYHVDHAFRPDVLVDGGGNIGLFTIRAVAEQQACGNTAMRPTICEPMTRNIDQIQRHLAANRIDAEIMQSCLGGERRSIPFYCRDAINSSFDPEKPYNSVIEVPVSLLEDAIGDRPAERILVKLDIEGMEVEVLEAFVPRNRRPVYVVGELHEFPVNAPQLERLFQANNWTYRFWGFADDQAMFHACSPEALHMLPSMMAVQSGQPV